MYPEVGVVLVYAIVRVVCVCVCGVDVVVVVAVVAVCGYDVVVGNVVVVVDVGFDTVEVGVYVDDIVVFGYVIGVVWLVCM